MNMGTFGQAPGVDSCFEFGMTQSSRHSIPIDFISGHKWLNPAAMHRNSPATRLRIQAEYRLRSSGWSLT
jgi:hypothetical protein